MASLHHKKYGFEQVGILYALALSGIALAIILSQVYIQRYITKQEDDSHIINLAGRQRMLSQKISKAALQIGEADNPKDRQFHSNALKNALRLWEKSHEGLLHGDAELGVTGENSHAIDSMYQAIAPFYKNIQAHGEAIIQSIRADVSVDNQLLQPHISGILDNEAQFLNVMDAIVFQYDKEARDSVLHLKTIELVLLAISLGIILFELLFIFRPAARQIKKTIQELTESEKVAKDMAREIGVLYGSLENSYQELAAINSAEEQPVVLCKATKNGDIADISDQFMEMLAYDIREKAGNFFEWLEKEGYGKDQVQHISCMTCEGKVWNGEVRVTSDEGDFIWLDINIVPILDEDEQVSAYNIVGVDKTERKEAEARAGEITREKIDKKVNEQRFRSILILEGQEEERRRISRDIHDGIGQLLTGLKLKIEGINLASDMTEREQKVEQTKDLLDRVIREVRRVSFNLNPSALSDYGLVPVTRRFCTEASRLSDKQVIFENQTGFINRMDKSVETNLYRIIQEAVNNAIKYAQAEEIKVVFSHKAHYLNIKIADNGVGFDYQKYLERENIKGSGLGIFNMQERVNFIHGTFEIASQPGQGTQINIHLPMNGRRNENY